MPLLHLFSHLDEIGNEHPLGLGSNDILSFCGGRPDKTGNLYRISRGRNQNVHSKPYKTPMLTIALTASQVFWLTSYPSDVVKQRIMTDGLGKGHNGSMLSDGPKRFPTWKAAASDIWTRDGVRGFWRGFVPCFLRAFPANGMALVAFEGVMRTL